MTGPRAVPIVIRSDVDLVVRDGGLGIRGCLRVGTQARSDEERAVPVALRFGLRSGDEVHTRLNLDGTVLGPLQPRLAAAPPKASVRGSGRAEEIPLYDLTGEHGIDAPHALTGQPDPPRREVEVRIRAWSSEAEYDRDRYEARGLEERVAAIRAAARSRLLHREPEGWWVPAPVPTWQCVQNLADHPAWRVELSASQGRPEKTFGLGRLGDAQAFCRHLNGGVDGPLLGEVLYADPALVPTGDDLVALASRGATRAAALRLFDPASMSGSLVQAWSAARHGRAIAAEEGRAGAARVLAGCLHLADHIEACGHAIGDVGDWALLRERILFEGIGHAPRSGCDGAGRAPAGAAR